MEIFKEALANSLTNEEIFDSLDKSLDNLTLKKVLIIPPDFTRFHSNAGLITNYYYHKLINEGIDVDILPALGTHEMITLEQVKEMFGDIPYEKFIYHNWREDVVKIGEVPGNYISEITEGIWNKPIDVEVNKKLLDKSYDLVISIGQVVPHEVIGMANHSKNIFVGIGGKEMINSSHMVGALYGLERMMGKDHTPVRRIFDYALEHFLKDIKIMWVLTVTTNSNEGILTHGLFIDMTRKSLEKAIELAQKKNIIFVEHGIKKCIVYLNPKEFKTTWLGNKAVYRTRMAIEDNGELIIIAPGVKRFGEDLGVDEIIRKYGYCGRLKVLELFNNKNDDLINNMGAAAHLIHGSSDDRFSITYAVKEIKEEEIVGVNYKSASYDELSRIYNLNSLKPGYNIVGGEEVYFIPNPALGLWINKERF